MTLRAINRTLRKVGLVLVVSTDDETGLMSLWIERAKTYDARVKAAS